MYNTQSLLGKISTHSNLSFALRKLVLSYAPTNFTTVLYRQNTACGQLSEGKKSIMFNIYECHNLEGCLVFETVTTRNPIQKFCYRKQYKWFWKNKTSQRMYKNLFKKLWMSITRKYLVYVSVYSWMIPNKNSTNTN
jgi:hypothetical protein